MNLKDLQKLMDLNRRGLLSDEALGAAVESFNTPVAKLEETKEEEWERKHEELAEKNRKASGELRAKIKAREEQREKEAELARMQDEVETKAIEEIDFLSKLTNSRGERVYSDSVLDSMSYYELIGLAERVRNAQASVTEDRKEAMKGFAKEEVKSTPVVEKTPATIDDVKKLSEEHSSELDKMLDDYDKELGEVSTEEKSEVDKQEEKMPTLQEMEEHAVEEEKDEVQVSEETPRKMVKHEKGRGVKLIATAKDVLKKIIDSNITKSIVVLATAAAAFSMGMVAAPTLFLGAAGLAGYNEVKKGMGK